MPEAIIFNLILSAIVVFGLVYTVYVIHLIIDDASIIDLFWGAGFGLVAISLLIVTQPKTNYTVLLALLPILWAVRYTTFIFLRNWGKGEDDRYTDLRERTKEKGIPWWLFSFYGVYGFQSIAMLVVCSPLIIGMAAPESTQVTKLPIMGLLLWIIGFFFEAIGDLQLATFQEKASRLRRSQVRKARPDVGALAVHSAPQLLWQRLHVVGHRFDRSCRPLRMARLDWPCLHELCARVPDRQSK